MSRPTPETDNERTLKLALEVFTELAKTLKRERDEAREAFVIATDQMVQAQSVLRETRRDLAEAQIECLERARLLSMSSEREAKLIYERDEAIRLHKKSLCEREAAERETDAMLERAQKVERERDEAREVANGLANQVERLRKERDELQDALEHAVYAWESRWKAEVEFAYRVSIKRDELLDILRKLLEIIPEPECHDFGHTKEERHAFLEECPVMARYDALIAQAKEAAK